MNSTVKLGIVLNVTLAVAWICLDAWPSAAIALCGGLVTATIFWEKRA